jgi:hypothetical protein
VNRNEFVPCTIRSKQWYTNPRKRPNSCVNRSIGELQEASREAASGQAWAWTATDRRRNLVDEVTYIQQRAATRVGRIVTVGPVLLFSTETGDGWLLDPADHLAAPSARDGEALPLSIEDTEKTFSIAWQGSYAIVGDVFTFQDAVSGRVATFVGYPTQQLNRQTAKMLGPP